MSKLLESDEKYDKMQTSILQHSLNQKLKAYNHYNRRRPETGWMAGSREEKVNQRMLGDLDKFHRTNWKYVGPRGPLSQKEVADKDYWNTRSSYATKAYNKAYDDNKAFQSGSFPDLEKVKRTERLGDMENWWDSISKKQQASDFEKQWSERQKAFDDPTKLETSEKERERQKKMLELEVSKKYKDRRLQLRSGQLDREPKKTTTESIMSHRIEALTLILEKKKKQEMGPQPAPKPKTTADTLFGTNFNKADAPKFDPSKPAAKPKRQAQMYSAPKNTRGAGSWTRTAGPAVTDRAYIAPFDAATSMGVGGMAKRIARTKGPGVLSKVLKFGKGILGKKAVPSVTGMKDGMKYTTHAQPATGLRGKIASLGKGLSAIRSKLPSSDKVADKLAGPAKTGLSLGLRATRYMSPGMPGKSSITNKLLKSLGKRSNQISGWGALARYGAGQAAGQYLMKKGDSSAELGAKKWGGTPQPRGIKTSLGRVGAAVTAPTRAAYHGVMGDTDKAKEALDDLKPISAVTPVAHAINVGRAAPGLARELVKTGKKTVDTTKNIVTSTEDPVTDPAALSSVKTRAQEYADKLKQIRDKNKAKREKEAKEKK